MKSSIKNYFQSEVSKITPPPMPTLKKKKATNPWDNILLTALAVASMVIVYLPASYDSKIRTLVVTEVNKELLRENFTRAISEIDLYYLEKRGVLND